MSRKRKIIAHSFYVINFIFLGILQLVDFKIFHNDPQWHLYIYALVIPLLNIIFSFIFAEEEFFFIYPSVTTLFSITTFIFCGNDELIMQGLFFNVKNIFFVIIPSFVSPLIGMMLAKSKKFKKLIRRIKEKYESKFLYGKIETLPPKNDMNFKHDK